MSSFVTNEYNKLQSVLLCRPDNFDLQPINDIAREFMRRGERPDPERVRREHREFAEAIESFGAEVVWVEPKPDKPYQVFTRDIGVATRNGILLGRFFESVRQGEEEVAATLLKDRLPIWRSLDIEDGVAFEGGDFMYLDERLVALGIGARTTKVGADRVQAIMVDAGVEVIQVPFDSRYLHIDMIFNVVSEHVAAVCPEALPEDFLTLVKERGFELIEEPPEGVFHLNCNLLALDNGCVLSTTRNKRANSQLQALGIEVIEVDLHDLLMGGGGPHCMSFPIRREE